ncbi:MAG: hypothetical protein QGF21_00865 [Vicinamibacterales bacterium]|nr:hypothetical protein [Vicinamibacterales bacterium]MDP7670477.1 hypothetical protein [Vicinamibacterales bacterium]HJO38135.1 hypothetical protein [Vicinamibacterales bacterium]
MTKVRARMAVAAFALGISVVVAGCGSGVAMENIGGPIDIEVTQLFINVTNRTGTAIADVKLEVFPVGRQMVFSVTQYRLESEALKKFSMSDLRGSDGTPFNLRVHRPQSVKVSAEGVDGSLHAIEIPWE